MCSGKDKDVDGGESVISSFLTICVCMSLVKTLQMSKMKRWSFIVFVCSAYFSTNLASVRLQSVSISTNATQPFVTDGTTQMTLFCRTDDVYPAISYTWAGVTCINEHHEHGTCIFTPRVPQDHGRQVTCDAYSVVSFERRTSDPYTIQLNYPPPSPPIIRGYEEGSVLTEGEKFILDCEVKGGKPKVRSVRFVCVDEPDNPDIVDGMSVWSRVVINVKTKHNDTVCLCSATWSPQPRFYSNTTFLRLYVNESTMPRSPSITTRKMYTRLRQTPVQTSQVTHVTTSAGLGSSPSPQSKPGQSVPIGVIAGIVAAVVVAVIVIAAIVYVTRRRQSRK